MGPKYQCKKVWSWAKNFGGIHILEDAHVYRQCVFHALLHRFNGRRHTGSILIEYFYRLLGILSVEICTTKGIYNDVRDREAH